MSMTPVDPVDRIQNAGPPTMLECVATKHHSQMCAGLGISRACALKTSPSQGTSPGKYESFTLENNLESQRAPFSAEMTPIKTCYKAEKPQQKCPFSSFDPSNKWYKGRKKGIGPQRGSRKLDPGPLPVGKAASLRA